MIADLAASAAVGLGARPPRLDQLPVPLRPEPGDDPAGEFLDAAALGTLAARAARGLATDRWEVPANGPLPPDPVVQGAALSTLQHLMGERPHLAAVALTVLAERGAALPIHHLPELADKALSPGSPLRQVLAGAVGARGRWLLAQHPRWRALLTAAHRHDVEPAPDAWAHGGMPERIAWLQAVRATDPVGGLAALREDWRQLKAQERAELVAVLETGLGSGDYEFLLDCLRERSEQVVNAALRLLARYPSGPHAEHRAALIRQHFQYRRGLLGDQLAVSELPADATQGIRAGAEYSVVSFVRHTPLALWEQVLGADPTRLVTARRSGVEWDAVKTFLKAAAAQRAYGLVGALLADAAAPWEEVAATDLSPQWRLHLTARMLNDVKQSPLVTALTWLGAPFPPELSDHVVAAVARQPAQLGQLEAAAWLANCGPAHLDQLRSLAARLPDTSRPAAVRTLGQLTLLIRLRQELS